ncbi:MATH domain-containing protein [Trifolium medium]|uniref:MATH domain-containing protein n=1 Tax=Trifolium medium TaxID=97028 RepID=A0A392NXV9_9FABA|nr:MATH domain-containing protein [Trifolium medium]
MAGVLSEESGVGKSAEGISRGQHSTGEALAEWRSSEQVENGIASTSPPYWDTDEDDGAIAYVCACFSKLWHKEYLD